MKSRKAIDGLTQGLFKNRVILIAFKFSSLCNTLSLLAALRNGVLLVASQQNLVIPARN